MELIGKIYDYDSGFIDGIPKLIFTVEDKEATKLCCDELSRFEKLRIKLNPFRKKRSKNANAYLWELCTKLAQKIGTTKESVYRQHILNMGVCEQAVIREDAVESMIERWQRGGTGWLIEKIDNAGIPGYVLLNIYFGSSTYDTAEMSRLINSVVEDCKEQGIQTETPDEIANMMSLWESGKRG